MKVFLSALVAISALAASVQAQAQSILDIVPQRPIDCVTQNHPYVNQVYALRHVREDAKTAEFQFRTRHGVCQYTVYTPYALDPDFVYVAGVSDRTIMPWQKENIKTKYRVISPTETEVTVIFNTAKIFKKRDADKFSLYFMPFGAFGLRYGWDLYLQRGSRGSATILDIRVVP